MGVDPRDETFKTKAELVANEVEKALGVRNGRLRPKAWKKSVTLSKMCCLQAR